VDEDVLLLLPGIKATLSSRSGTVNLPEVETVEENDSAKVEDRWSFGVGGFGLRDECG
jgi:hypothetical protein